MPPNGQLRKIPPALHGVLWLVQHVRQMVAINTARLPRSPPGAAGWCWQCPFLRGWRSKAWPHSHGGSLGQERPRVTGLHRPLPPSLSELTPAGWLQNAPRSPTGPPVKPVCPQTPHGLIRSNTQRGGQQKYRKVKTFAGVNRVGLICDYLLMACVFISITYPMDKW